MKPCFKFDPKDYQHSDLIKKLDGKHITIGDISSMIKLRVQCYYII